jgi:hypothetical protein
LDLTVFYAWQSDRPAKLNRYLIRDTAKAACERITADVSNPWTVILDSDTQGEAGMCDIPNTILEKIARCDLFLADLTFVGRTDESDDVQQLPNANVLFELGYAARCLGFNALVGIVNEAFGSAHGQVFDIKRRASVRYSLPVNATSEQQKQERERLGHQLEDVFRTALPIAVAARRTLPVHISGSSSLNVPTRDRAIVLTVTNTSDKPFPPYELAIWHPKLGTYSMFSSEKSGPLLPDQKRQHRCIIIQNEAVPDYLSHFDCSAEGSPLTELDDRDFELRLVLEDSDRILFANKRIARGFVRLIRQARKRGSAKAPMLGGAYADWTELNSSLPDD